MKKTAGSLLLTLFAAVLVSCPHSVVKIDIPGEKVIENDNTLWFAGIYDKLMLPSGSDTPATKQYVCDAINVKSGISVSPGPKTEAEPASCRYLLSMIDEANGGLTSYGTGNYAVPQIARTETVDRTVELIYAKKFVALADNSDRAAFSGDGITWEAAFLPESASWCALAYGGGRYVALADGSDMAAYSPDGITWKKASLPGAAAWKKICYGPNPSGGGLFIAVADGSNKAGVSVEAAVSDDGGATWTMMDLPTSDKLPIRPKWSKLVFSNTTGGGVFVLTVNGVSKSIVYYNGTSAGGSWQEADLPSVAYWQSLVYGNNKFVTVAGGGNTGAGNRPASSPDGSSWTAGTTTPVFGPIASHDFGESLKLEMPTHVNALTNYAISEIPGAVSPLDIPNYTLVENTYDSTNYFWDSAAPDPKWRFLGGSLDSLYWYDLAFGNNTFVSAAYNSRQAAYSPDGSSWTTAALPNSGQWNSVSFGGGRFLIMVLGFTSNKTVYSGDNGISWTEKTLPVSRKWSGICYGSPASGGKFVAVSANPGAAAYLIDGAADWKKTSLPDTGSWQCVIYGE
jgi:hypothetical protein